MLRLYDYECTECERVFEAFCLNNEDVQCPKCYSNASRLPPTVHINMGVGAYGYFDETLDKGISTNRQLKEEMRKQGVTKKGDTPKSGGAWY
jgi:putative FmdB family regulatory protein